MTKTTEGLHYIYDEALQCEREYEEVSGEASVGDTILMVDHAPLEIEAGTVLTITDKTDFDARYDKYIKLAPTGNVRLASGETYTLSDRKAAVGDTVLISTDSRLFRHVKGATFNVVKVDEDNGFVNLDGQFDDGSKLNAHPSQYRVLDPIEPAPQPDPLANLREAIREAVGKIADSARDNTPAGPPKDSAELLANLVRRMSSVEKTLGYDQFGPGKLPELSSKVSDNHHAINALEETVEQERKENDDFAGKLLGKLEALTQEMTSIKRDLQTFAEVSEEAKYQAKHARDLSEDNAKDIVTLDERTQPEKLAETVAKENVEIHVTYPRKAGKTSQAQKAFDAIDTMYDYKRKGGCV